MHEAAATWEDAVYNLARPLKTLRIDLTGPLNGKPGRRWRPRTPAMAAGLTDEVWRIEQLLQSVVPLIRQHVRGPLPKSIWRRILYWLGRRPTPEDLQPRGVGGKALGGEAGSAYPVAWSRPEFLLASCWRREVEEKAGKRYSHDKTRYSRWSKNLGSVRA